MKKINLILIAILFGGFMFVQSVEASTLLFESASSSTSYQQCGVSDAFYAKKCAFEFTPTSTLVAVNEITFKLQAGSSTAQVLTYEVSIYKNGSEPEEGTLVSNGSISGNIIPTSSVSWVSSTLNSNVTFSSGTKYFIVLDPSSDLPVGQNIRWFYLNSGGGGWQYGADGSVWISVAPEKPNIRLYGSSLLLDNQTSFIRFPNGNFSNGTSTDYLLRVDYYNNSTSSGYIHVAGVQTAGNITRGNYSFTKNIGAGDAGSDYYTLSNLTTTSTWVFNGYVRLDPDNYLEAQATPITGTFAAGEDPNQIRISLTGSYGLGTHVSSTCNYGDAFFSAQEIACETMELIKWAVYPSDTSLQTLQNAVKSWNVIFPFNIIFDTYGDIENKLAVQTENYVSSTLTHNGVVVVDFVTSSMQAKFGSQIKNQVYELQKFVFYFGLGISIIATILLL